MLIPELYEVSMVDAFTEVEQVTIFVVPERCTRNLGTRKISVVKRLVARTTKVIEEEFRQEIKACLLYTSNIRYKIYFYDECMANKETLKP